MDFTLAAIAFVISIIIINVSQRAFLSNKVVDEINHRSSHTTTATRTGGLSIAATIISLTFYFYLFGSDIYNFSLLIPLLILLSIGLYDDVYNVDFKLKFIFQIIAAKLIVDSGLIVDNFHGLFGLFEINRLIAHMITIVIIVAIINSINFIDGIDGLAITIVALFIMLFEAFSSTNTPYIYLSTITVLAIVPLYYYNYRKKNKVFLGDSGSLFLGGLVSIYVLHILSNDYIIQDKFDINKIIFVFSILPYPIIDFTRIFFKRIINRRSPFLADKNHIHHKLLNYFSSHIVVVSIIISSSIIIFLLSQGYNFFN
tara:strand:+ start:1644 stop:2585 length:942 start_codon:yes stop_codon:yes gene_type:complete